MQRESAFFSRRMLLGGLGVGAVAAAAPVLGLGADGSGSSRSGSGPDRTLLSLPAAGLSEWSALAGETFALVSPNGLHRLRVGAVAAFPGSGRGKPGLSRSRAFSVAFESVGGPPLPPTDGVYRLVHRAFAPLPLYMGAPARVGRTTRLIAVFN